MLPLKRALTELEHDIRDAHNAMDQVVTSSPIILLDVQGLVSHELLLFGNLMSKACMFPVVYTILVIYLYRPESLIPSHGSYLRFFMLSVKTFFGAVSRAS